MFSRLFLAIVCASMMFCAGYIAMRAPDPNPITRGFADLDNVLPTAFGEWRKVSLFEVVLPPETALLQDAEIAYRAYSDRVGRIITLVVVYSEAQSDSLRLHLPETCYVSQGFMVSKRRAVTLTLADREVNTVFLDAERGMYKEAVGYWLRNGDKFVAAPFQMQLRGREGGSGLSGNVLVRVSTPFVANAPHDLLAEFLTDFERALEPNIKQQLLGGQ